MKMNSILPIILVVTIVSFSLILFQQQQQQQQVYGQPTDWNAEIDKCMTSLKAENPRPAHLLECDEFMPMVPQMIAVEMIYNTSDVNQKVDEYLTLRSLEAYTEEEMRQKVEEQQ